MKKWKIACAVLSVIAVVAICGWVHDVVMLDRVIDSLGSQNSVAPEKQDRPAIKPSGSGPGVPMELRQLPSDRKWAPLPLLDGRYRFVCDQTQPSDIRAIYSGAPKPLGKGPGVPVDRQSLPADRNWIPFHDPRYEFVEDRNQPADVRAVYIDMPLPACADIIQIRK